jgi:hypothetical protein
MAGNKEKHLTIFLIGGDWIMDTCIIDSRIKTKVN